MRLVSAVKNLLGIAVLVVVPAYSATLNFNGDTTGGPTWNRPLSGTPPTVLSAVGTATPYEATLLSVSSDGSYTFQSTAAWDNFSLLYLASFDPNSQFTNALVANDDNPTIGLSGFSINLTAGTQYILVVTGFGNSDAGTYAESISGPGNITLGRVSSVPEPASCALVGAGVLLLAGLRRRRR